MMDYGPPATRQTRSEARRRCGRSVAGLTEQGTSETGKERVSPVAMLSMSSANKRKCHAARSRALAADNEIRTRTCEVSQMP